MTDISNSVLFCKQGAEISFWIFPPPACRDTRTRETHLTVRLRLRHTPLVYARNMLHHGDILDFSALAKCKELKSICNEFKKNCFKMSGKNIHANRYYWRK